MIRNTGKAIQGNENTTKLINWLKNSPTKYPTLTKEQEREMIEKYRNNRPKLNELLILHNMKIVFSLAKQYASKTDDFDSMVQDGMLGLTEAAQRFDLDMDIKFITYAHVWVQKCILSSFYTKNIDVDRHSTSLNATYAAGKDGDVAELQDYVNDFVDPSCHVIKSFDDEISAVEQERLCKELYNTLQADTTLSATDKGVFIDLFYNREKTIDIIDKYEVTREEILDIKHKVLSKLKNVLACDYGITEYDDVR